MTSPIEDTQSSARDTQGEDTPARPLEPSQSGRAVIRGGFFRIASYAAGAVLTVAANAVVIRHLGVVDTGRFITIMALALIAVTVGEFGLASVGVREYSVRAQTDGHRYLRNLLGIRIAVGASGIAVAVVFAAVAGYTRAMVIGTVIAGLGMLILVVQQALTIPLQVRHRFGLVAILSFLFQLGVAVTAGLLVLAHAGLAPFFAMSLISAVPLLALTVVIGGKDCRMLPVVDVREWRRMVTTILPYSAAVVLSVLYFRVAILMVSLLSSEAETGYFGVAFRILDSLTTVPLLLAATALPVLSRAAHSDGPRFSRVTRRLAEGMTIAGVGLALATVLGAGFAVDLFAGPGFGPSVGVLQLLAIALLGTFTIAARGYSLLALDRMRAILICNAIALCVVVALGVPMIAAGGAKGAAVALVAAELTLALGYERSLTRNDPDLRLPGRFMAGVVGAAALATAPAFLFENLPSLAHAGIGLAIFGAAVAAFGAVPFDLREVMFTRPAREPSG